MARSGFRDRIRRLVVAATAAVACTGSLRAAPCPSNIPLVRCAATPLTPQTNGSLQQLAVLFVSAGYRSTEAGRFEQDARKLACDILILTPFKENAKSIGLHAAALSDPDYLQVRPAPSQAGDCGFQDAGQTTVDRIGNVRRALLQNTPLRRIDYVVILVKDGAAMGCGGGPAIYATNNLSAGVLAHELGHSLADLRDEYGGKRKLDRRPARRNCTSTLDPSKMPWPVNTDQLPSDGLHDPNIVGAYTGCDHVDQGLYRPTFSCRMGRDTSAEFCTVCRDWIVKELKAQIRRLSAEPMRPAPFTRRAYRIVGTALMEDELEVGGAYYGRASASGLLSFSARRRCLARYSRRSAAATHASTSAPAPALVTPVDAEAWRTALPVDQRRVATSSWSLAAMRRASSSPVSGRRRTNSSPP